MRDFSEIIPIYERRWADEPASCYFLPLANAYRAVGQPTRAIEVLQEGLERHPELHSARAALAAAYLDAELTEEAEEEAKRVLAAQPENLFIRRLLVDCYRESGRPEEALSQMKELLEIAPEDKRLQATLQALEGYMAQEAEEVLAEGEAPVEEPAVVEEEEASPKDFSEVLAEVGTPEEELGEVVAEEDEILLEDVVLEEEPAEVVEEEKRPPEGLEEGLEEEPAREPQESLAGDEEPLEGLAEPPGEEEEAPAEEPVGVSQEEPGAEGRAEPQPTATLAELYAMQGHLEDASAVYRQLLEREPDNESYRLRLEAIEAELAASENAEERPVPEETAEQGEPEASGLEHIVNDSDAVREIHSLFPPEPAPEGVPREHVISSLEGWLAAIKRRSGPEPPAVDIS